jgi:hypothetical protein
VPILSVAAPKLASLAGAVLFSRDTDDAVKPTVHTTPPVMASAAAARTANRQRPVIRGGDDVDRPTARMPLLH